MPRKTYFPSLALSVTSTDLTILSDDYKGPRAVYGDTTKKAVSAHACLRRKQREGQFGAWLFRGENDRFFQPLKLPSHYLC